MDITGTELFSSRYNFRFYSLLSQDFAIGNEQLVSKDTHDDLSLLCFSV